MYHGPCFFVFYTSNILFSPPLFFVNFLMIFSPTFFLNPHFYFKFFDFFPLLFFTPLFLSTIIFQLCDFLLIFPPIFFYFLMTFFYPQLLFFTPTFFPTFLIFLPHFFLPTLFFYDLFSREKLMIVLRYLQFLKKVTSNSLFPPLPFLPVTISPLGRSNHDSPGIGIM